MGSIKPTLFLYTLLVSSGDRCRNYLLKLKASYGTWNWGDVSLDGRDEIRLHSTSESSILLGGHIGFGWRVKQGYKKRFDKSRISYHSNTSSFVTHQLHTLQNRRGSLFKAPAPHRSFENRSRNIDILYIILKRMVWRFRFSINFSKIF